MEFRDQLWFPDHSYITSVYCDLTHSADTAKWTWVCLMCTRHSTNSVQTLRFSECVLSLGYTNCAFCVSLGCFRFFHIHTISGTYVSFSCIIQLHWRVNGGFGLQFINQALGKCSAVLPSLVFHVISLFISFLSTFFQCSSSFLNSRQGSICLLCLNDTP